MKHHKVINNVDCYVAETYFKSEKTHFVIPQKVKGVPFFEFAINLCAQNSPTPKSEACCLAFFMTFYLTYCYRYLLNERKFDLFSLSSPHCPSLRGLSRNIPITPTGSRLLDNIQIMLFLGKSFAGKSWDELLCQAIYKYPDRIPVRCDMKNFDVFINQELKRLERCAFQIMAERKDPVKNLLQEILDRYLSLCCFIAEQVTFEVVHQGMQDAHDMIKHSLSPGENSLFEFICLKNPKYLNRVILFDPSPIFISFRDILAIVYDEIGVERALQLLDETLIAGLFLAYINFYPTWLRFVQDDEKEKDEQERRKERGEIPYDPSLDMHIRYGSDYEADPLLRAFILLGESYGKGKDKYSRKHPKKTKRGKMLTFLTDSQREILRFEAEGKLGKDIAQLLKCSPSTISKKQRKIKQILHQSWEKEVWKAMRSNAHESLKKVYDKLDSKRKGLFKHFYFAHIIDPLREICKCTSFDPDKIVEEFTPPFLRE